MMVRTLNLIVATIFHADKNLSVIRN